ncbi:MAG: type III pantothenate kinase, partial [Syntrophothermus sp.]
TPDTLGRDRIAAATGGQSLFPGHDVLVINAGTCITYDFVTGNREYAGGSISPGMMMRFRALHTFTGKLPLLSPDETEILTGNSTESSIQSGVMEGITAEMEGITGKYRSLYPELKVVLSGGDLNYFVNRLKINIFAFPNIVIQGLHQILKFNVDNPY